MLGLVDSISCYFIMLSCSYFEIRLGLMLDDV
jgi:hypothetical protein